MHPVVIQVGSRVRSFRKRSGLRAVDVAESAGLSLRFFRQLEAGQANISISRLASVAEALNVPLESFFVREGSRRSHLSLLGIRGAGKSTVGPILARALQMPFVEVDGLVERSAGLTLAEIFALHGEHYYRRLERDALEAILSTSSPSVLALSGGVIANVSLYERVLEDTFSVWLKAEARNYMQRVLGQKDFRPMENRANPMDELSALVESRAPQYARASFVVDTSSDSPEQTASRIISAWRGRMS